MQNIQGISRHQLQMSSLEDKITADNPVRFIEAFVNHIDIGNRFSTQSFKKRLIHRKTIKKTQVQPQKKQ